MPGEITIKAGGGNFGGGTVITAAGGHNSPCSGGANESGIQDSKKESSITVEIAHAQTNVQCDVKRGVQASGMRLFSRKKMFIA